MNYLFTLLRILVVAVVSLVSGAIGAYWINSMTPVPVPIAVLDLDAAVGRLDPNSPHFEDQRKRLEESIKRRTSELVSAGVIVLDRSKVIAAPPDAMVKVE